RQLPHIRRRELDRLHRRRLSFGTLEDLGAAEPEPAGERRLRGGAVELEIAGRDGAQRRRVRDAEVAQARGELERGIGERPEPHDALGRELLALTREESQARQPELVTDEVAGELAALVLDPERRQLDAYTGEPNASLHPRLLERAAHARIEREGTAQ